MEIWAVSFSFLLMTVQNSLGFARMYHTKFSVNNQKMDLPSSQNEDSLKESDSSISPLIIDYKLILEDTKRITTNGTFNFEG